LVFLDEQGSWRLACASGQAACLLPETEVVPPYVLATLSDMGRTRRPYRLQTGKAGSARHEGLLRHYAVADLLCVPIASEDGTLGLICAAQPPEGGFQAEDLRILSLLSSSAVIGMENARLYEVERRLRGQEAERAAAAERGRLARELHDAVTQTLFSASLIAEVLPRIWEKNPRQGRERLEEVRLLTRGALAEMRTLLLELRPRALEDTALDVLLKHLVTAVSARSGMTVTSEMSACGGLPFDVKLGFYRIAQEALSNIAKHAQATHVQVMVRANGASGDASGVKFVSGDATGVKSVSGDAAGVKFFNGDVTGVKSFNGAGQACTSLEMEIRDDGRGFNPDAISGGHLGVGIMRERAESIGSRFEMVSITGKGTTIRVLWRSNLTGSGE
jgi:signal transduction histidine kinase